MCIVDGDKDSKLYTQLLPQTWLHRGEEKEVQTFGEHIQLSAGSNCSEVPSSPL